MTVDWNDRAMETALEEVLGNAAPAPRVLHNVLSASPQQSAMIRARVDALGASPRWQIRWLAIAAGLLFGVTTLFLVRSLQPDPGSQWRDRVEDPRRVVPRDVEELRQMLSRVDEVSVRETRIEWEIWESDQAADPIRIQIDVDRELQPLVSVPKPNGGYFLLVAHLIELTRHPIRAETAKYLPGMRLVLHLTGDDNLHVLIDDSLVVRIPGLGEFSPPARSELANSIMNCRGELLESSIRARVQFGLVLPGSDLGMPTNSGEWRFPSNVEHLQVFDVAPWDLRRLERFTDLRGLEILYSPRLTSESLSKADLTEPVLAVFAELRAFHAPALRLDDADIATWIGRMRALIRLDLRDCASIGPDTLRALASHPTVCDVDLRGASGWPSIGALGRSIADCARRVRVMLVIEEFAVAARAELDGLTDGRIVWLHGASEPTAARAPIRVITSPR